MPAAKKSVKKTSPKRRGRPTKTSPKRRGRPTKTSPKRRGRPTRRRMNAPGDEKTKEELQEEVADLREEKARALEALRRLEETLEVHIRQMKWSYEAGNLDCADFSEEISDVKGGLEYIIEELE